MKIIAIVRARNEETNIARFCNAYQWADRILVADGGSTDNTVEIANNIPKVSVRPFHKRVEMKNGYWRNPEHEHINFLIDWALDEGADWIIFDDCDCVPNYLLKRDGRKLLETNPFNFAFVVRLYLWGEDKHFPSLAQPLGNNQYVPSLWAWNRKAGVRFVPAEVHFSFAPIPEQHEKLEIIPGYCLLHRPWPDVEAAQKKADFYNKSGEIEGMTTAINWAGPLKDLPEWARD